MNSFFAYAVPLLTSLTLRAQMLAMLILLGYVIGEFFARGPFSLLLKAGDALVVRLQKLDKPNRGIATLVYRGMIAVFMLLMPAMAAAALLSKPIPELKLVTDALLVVWFGHCFETWRTLCLYRRAKVDGLPLELPRLDYLFADSHAVIRYLVARHIHGFTIGVVGASFWYLLGGLSLMVAYLTLAALADTYRTPAFGWAARSLFLLMDIVPRFISRILLTLASIFTPQTKPFAGSFAPTARGAIANTLDVALGGPTPKGDLPWVGKGTARLSAKHLLRASTIILAATVLLTLALVTPAFIRI